MPDCQGKDILDTVYSRRQVRGHLHRKETIKDVQKRAKAGHG